LGTARTRAQNKFIAKAYDRVNLTMPKGKKETIQAHAEARGESVNGFINRAIDQTMEQDTEGGEHREHDGAQPADIGAQGRGVVGEGDQ